ncbi:hypothetical protein E2I00_003234 [Balaenoptera physalus]|uniref:Uncharacterized protein n=1 Tax=Balaenoptera physalus TaxID=9770 RepID=A0A6A1Q1J5_BALPH|nr:hypothetical protein E2I00_003234 [Balaenoptera physalus]
MIGPIQPIIRGRSLETHLS